MNGRLFADPAREIAAQVKVLFIIGYANVNVLGSNTMELGTEVLTKPFRMEAFATKVNAMLNASRNA